MAPGTERSGRGWGPETLGRPSPLITGCCAAHEVSDQHFPALGALGALSSHLLTHPTLSLLLLCVGSKLRFFFLNKSERLVNTYCVPGTKCILFRTFRMLSHLIIITAMV